MNDWLNIILRHLRDNTPICRVIVADAKGSTPRESGADMFVTAAGISGTIGGGRLEFEAIAIAQKMLDIGAGERAGEAAGFRRHCQSFALGPNLGQCCGGRVVLFFEAFFPAALDALTPLQDAESTGWSHDGKHATALPAPSDAGDFNTHYDSKSQRFSLGMAAQNRALYVYGAGHVGRALMDITGGLGFDRYWVDDDAARFPDAVGARITCLPVQDMPTLAAHAHEGAFHVVMTYAHRLDEAIILAILQAGNFARLGLIGSKSKARRFHKNLADAEVDAASLAHITCPIGLASIKGKAPPRVALSIAAQLVIWLDELADSPPRPRQ